MGRGEAKHAMLNGENVEKLTNDAGKGRNKELLELRNDTMMHRYYYWSRVHKKKYDDILQMLSLEFFLHPVSIGRYLQERLTDKAQEIFKTKPTINKMKKQFPQFVWHEPTRQEKEKKVVFVN